MEYLIGNILYVAKATATVSAWPILVIGMIMTGYLPIDSIIEGTNLSADEPASWLIMIPALILSFFLIPTGMLFCYGGAVMQTPMLSGIEWIGKLVGVVVFGFVGSSFGVYFADKWLPRLDKAFGIDSGYTPFMSICMAFYAAYTVRTVYKVGKGMSKSSKKRKKRRR